MKKYEYKVIVFQQMRNQLRESDPALKNVSEGDIMQRVLDKIGAEGWDIKLIDHGDIVLQREVK